MQTDKTEGGFHGYLRSDQIAAPTGKLAESFVLCWVYLVELRLGPAHGA